MSKYPDIDAQVRQLRQHAQPVGPADVRQRAIQESQRAAIASAERHIELARAVSRLAVAVVTPNLRLHRMLAVGGLRARFTGRNQELSSDTIEAWELVKTGETANEFQNNSGTSYQGLALGTDGVMRSFIPAIMKPHRVVMVATNELATPADFAARAGITGYSGDGSNTPESKIAANVSAANAYLSQFIAAHLPNWQG